MASLYNIHLRTGCFCNTGACQQFLNLSNEQIKSNLSAGHVCGDDIDLIAGKPTGSVRISFGYMSNFDDAKTFLNFLRGCFLEGVLLNSVTESTGTTPHNGLLDMAKLTTDPSSKYHPQSVCNNNGATEDHSMIRRSSDLPEVLPKSNATELLPHNVKNSALENSRSPSNLEQDFPAGSLLNAKHSLLTSGTSAKLEDCNADSLLYSGLRLEQICLYPIKSCAAFEVINPRYKYRTVQ